VFRADQARVETQAMRASDPGSTRERVGLRLRRFQTTSKGQPSGTQYGSPPAQDSPVAEGSLPAAWKSWAGALTPLSPEERAPPQGSLTHRPGPLNVCAVRPLGSPQRSRLCQPFTGASSGRTRLEPKCCCCSGCAPRVLPRGADTLVKRAAIGTTLYGSGLSGPLPYI
jgi:hypothetical protein